MSENTKGQERNARPQSQDAQEELRDSGGRQNASANRGGTADLDDEALTTGRRNSEERGSGIATKNSVTGSDYDGQLSNE